MTKVSGAAAFQQLQVPRDGISQATQFWGSKIADQQAAKKLADERESVRKRKEYDKLTSGLSGEGITGTMLNQESIDDITTNYAKQATNKALQFEREALDKLDAGDNRGFNEYKQKSNKVRASFKQYNTLLDAIKPRIDEYMKESDSYNPFDKRYKMYDAIIKNNILPIVNDEGQLRLIVGLDKDGDGEISTEERSKANQYIREGAETTELEYEEINPHDLMNGFYNQYKKVPITEKGGLLDELASNVGIATYDEQDGRYFINKQSGFDDNKFQELKNLVEVKLKEPETLAWVMNTMPDGIQDKVEGFSPEEISKAADFITKQTIAKYPSETSRKYLGQREATDSRAAIARRKDKGKQDEDRLSNLHFDAVRFTEGDYTGLLGRHTTISGETNIREVIPAPDGSYVVAITDNDDRIEVPKTKRGFLEFKMRGNSEYKKLNPEMVLQTQPVSYREGTTEGSPITNIANDLFDEEGKPTVDDEKFLKRLNDSFGIQGEDNFTWAGDSLKINGKKVDTSSKENFVSSLNNALKEKVEW